MHIGERTVGDVVIVDVSGKVTLGDGGDVMLKDKMRSLVQQGRKQQIRGGPDITKRLICQIVHLRKIFGTDWTASRTLLQACQLQF